MDLEKKILSDINVFQKYAKYLPKESRRETWEEIIDRNKLMHLKKYPKLHAEIEEAYKLVYEKKILPSMRSLQFSGKPIEINPLRIFNCSALAVDCVEAFSEIMFVLLSGCGIGFSVQSHHIKKLPEIKKSNKTKRYLIADSIEGWSDSIDILVRAYFENKPIPSFDYRDIRAKGTLLATSGGRAPGPEPLRHCLENIKTIFDRKKDGEKLTSLEIHDIVCFLADAVLAGGIRRSACISLFDIDDEEMLSCKGNFYLPPVGTETQHNVENDIHQFYIEYRGERKSITLSNGAYEEYVKNNTLPWYYVAPQRGRANNSAVVLRHKIDKKTFLNLWEKVKKSNSGEPGIFFSNDKDVLTNPCAEISLRNAQTCNLVEINAGDITTQQELNERSKAASFIATLQAGYFNFHYLRDEWREIAEKECLIGVSLTGIASGDVLKLDLEEAANIVKDENAKVAKLIGINKAARCTTVKPSGNASVVLGTSSGIHAWHSKYYLRRIRILKNDPVCIYFAKNHPELLEDDKFNSLQSIIAIPQKAPDNAITREESPLDLLNRVALIWEKWIQPGHRKGSNTNNISCTVSVKENEWEDVSKWMWENKTKFTALSVLPADLGTYVQAPFEEITKKKYDELIKLLSDIDLTKVREFEDNTTLQGEAACGGGNCEII